MAAVRGVSWLRRMAQTGRIATVACPTEWLQIVRCGVPLFPEVRPLLSGAAERSRRVGRACDTGRSMGRLKKDEIFQPMAGDAGPSSTRVSRMVRRPIPRPDAKH